MDADTRSTVAQRKPGLFAVLVVVSCVINLVLVAKMAFLDANIPLHPVCADGGGSRYVFGTTNEQFRDEATTPALALATYFGFRRTEEQIYVSVLDYLSKGDQSDGFLGFMNGLYTNSQRYGPESVAFNPLYVAWRRTVERNLEADGLTFEEAGIQPDCTLVRALTIED
jgi:hypothetical protein